MAAREEILLVERNFVRRTITEETIAAQQTIINQLATVQPSLAQRIANIGNEPVHLIQDKTYMTIFSRVTSLPTVIQYRLSEDGERLVPVSNGDGTAIGFDPAVIPGTVRITEQWTVPLAICECFFVVRVRHANGVGQAVDKCFLLFRSRQNGELYAPAYPNIYRDGSICMGDEFRRNQQTRYTFNSLIDAYVSCHQSFFSTRSSSHLVVSKTGPLFTRRVTAAGSEWMTPANISAMGDMTALAFMAPITSLVYQNA